MYAYLYLQNSKSVYFKIPLQHHITSHIGIGLCPRKFEAAFNSELQSLAPTLSSSSHAEPYLTHLAQCILGVRTDQ
jgi:hypothetical protein